jgi:acyl-CoA thioester hydrolase
MPLRLRDLDILGHLNQAVYHELLEDARMGLLAKVLGGMHDHTAWVLVRVELDYRTEVRKDHEAVDVVARIEAVGGKSLKMAHEVLLPDGTVAASGRAVVVAWDGEARTSREITPSEREALQAAA